MTDSSLKNKVEEHHSLTPPSLPQKRSKAPEAGWAERRYAKRQEVTTELNFQSESNFYMGFTADISAGGIFVVTWDTVPLGHHITLSFSLPGLKEQIKAEGVVRWVREHNPTDPDLWPGMGIQFDKIDPDAQKAIEHFIKTREPIFYDE
ncbi:MAG: TIGR02266 family protein [Deltaproteobacteria bacterium]|nr:TIGR02266 family protein [Deltaproteobacteria bacterium]